VKFLEQISLSGMNPSDVLVNGILAILILIVGIFVGKIFFIGLKKTLKKLEIEKSIRPSFVNLFEIVVKWSIYLVFISLALNRLGIVALTKIFANMLIAIPSFIGALILLGIGFAIAIYLKDVIEESEVTGWKMFSNIIFCFVLYVFGIYSLKAALLFLAESTTNFIIIIFTIAYALAAIISIGGTSELFRRIKKI